ncbi:phosphatidylinositol dephosphorylation [Rhizoctonia solani]|uniref:Phosphatidylinositol dephosphorylation n=2 Tax=Rhizoctonia solani TaxID=456999 RepID=A0A8H7M1H1_9AGAM|nr:phosphatidylinositol dephosphorylation [Rhizoctonia solani]KAF8748205.1 phosphatidylinositol dephosphorylation [Rhizoctonia solani]
MADIHQLPSHSPWIAEQLPPLSAAWAGQPGNQDEDVILLRQRWLNEQLTQQDTELKHVRDISVRVGTFNVNGQDPKESLRPWLCPPDTTTATSDLIVLGFQELDLSTEALLISTTTLREDIWCEALMRDLAELGEEYVKLTSKQLVGVLIVVLIRRPILPLLAPSGVASSSAGVGILGTMGNKGGVALRLQLLDTTLVFMNAHLAASAHAVPPPDPNQTQPVFIGRGPIPMDAVVDRRNADYISLTDFNYRIDLLDDEIRAFIEDPTDKDYTTLLKFDQLKVQQHFGKAFGGMIEGPIRFKPCAVLNQKAHTRRPAWTDRILYQTARGKDKTVRLVEDSYQSYPAISLSDHKPVSADFIVQVEEMDRGLAETRMKQLIKNLGRLPLEEDVPRIRLSDDFIDFVGVRYLKPLIQELKIQNIGFITAYWRIIPLENGGPLHPDWVTIHPTSGVLLPGDSVAITITTSITNGIAAELNAGNKKLEDIVILRTIRGKDTFLPINGTWTYSPTALVRLPGPVRTSTVLKSAQLPPEKASSSPRELMRLINWLMKNSIEFDDLFEKPGDTNIVDQIVEALDTGAEFPFDEKTPDHGVALAFASALLLFLEEMPEPVIPYGLYAQCALTSSREQAYELNGNFQILDTLPGLNANMWISITAFLHYFCQQDRRAKNTDATRKIARIFAEVLWFDSMTMPLANRLSPLTRVGFLMFFITPH